MSQSPATFTQSIPFRLAAGLVLLAGLTMAAWTAFYMVKWHSPAPFMDQWGVVGKPLSLDTLFRQHNEHRIAVPRLFFFVDDLLGGQQIFNKAVIWLIAGLAAFYAMRITLFGRNGHGMAPIALVFGCFLALVYNGSQYENFDWGFQIQFLGVYALGIYALFCGLGAVSGERLAPFGLAKAYLAIALATFTMANGFLSGFALALFFLVAGGRIRWRLALGTLLYALLLFALYFTGFKFNENHTSLTEALAHPVRLLSYFAGVVGAVLDHPWSVWMGAFILIAMAGSLVFLWRKRFPAPQTALLAIAAYVAMSAGIVALGRSDFPLTSASSSRYDTLSIVALIALLGIALRGLLDQERQPRPALIVACGLALGSGFLPLVFQSQHEDHFSNRWIGRQRASASLINMAVYFPDTRYVFPGPSYVEGRLPDLQSQSISIFAGGLNDRIGQQETLFGTEAQSICEGVFDEVTPHFDGSNTATARGWVLGPKRPKAIYLVSPDNEIRAIGFTGIPRPDVARVTGERRALYSGFQATFARSAAGDAMLSAVADFGDGTLCRIHRSHAVPVSSVTRLAEENIRTGTLLDADPVMEGGWTPAGGFQTLRAPPSGDIWWGSWSGSDANSGTLSWPAVDLQGVSAIQFLVARGPTTGRLYVSFNTADGTVIDQIPLQAVSQDWSWVKAPVPEGVDMADIQFIDAGTEWGEWLAVADVRLIGAAD